MASCTVCGGDGTTCRAWISDLDPGCGRLVVDPAAAAERFRRAAMTVAEAGRRGGRAGSGAGKVRASSYAPGVGPWAGSRTRRYVVAPGVSADLCGRCVLATVDVTSLAEAEYLARPRTHLSHARYQQIHPHPEGR